MVSEAKVVFCGEVGGEEFGFLLRIAVASVGLVGGLDALLWVGC